MQILEFCVRNFRKKYYHFPCFKKFRGLQRLTFSLTMGGNGTCYANDEQHVTTGHAPARATFLTESTRLSFPLSSSSCTIPTSDSPHSPPFSYSPSRCICTPFSLSSSLSLSLSLSLSPSFSSLLTLPASLYPCSFRFVSSQPKSSISLP